MKEAAYDKGRLLCVFGLSTTWVASQIVDAAGRTDSVPDRTVTMSGQMSWWTRAALSVCAVIVVVRPAAADPDRPAEQEQAEEWADE